MCCMCMIYYIYTHTRIWDVFLNCCLFQITFLLHDEWSGRRRLVLNMGSTVRYVFSTEKTGYEMFWGVFRGFEPTYFPFFLFVFTTWHMALYVLVAVVPVTYGYCEPEFQGMRKRKRWGHRVVGGEHFKWWQSGNEVLLFSDEDQREVAITYTIRIYIYKIHCVIYIHIQIHIHMIQCPAAPPPPYVGHFEQEIHFILGKNWLCSSKKRIRFWGNPSPTLRNSVTDFGENQPATLGKWAPTLERKVLGGHHHQRDHPIQLLPMSRAASWASPTSSSPSHRTTAMWPPWVECGNPTQGRWKAWGGLDDESDLFALYRRDLTGQPLLLKERGGFH